MTAENGATGPQDIDIDILAKGVATKHSDKQSRQQRVISGASLAPSLGVISEEGDSIGDTRTHSGRDVGAAASRMHGESSSVHSKSEDIESGDPTLLRGLSLTSPMGLQPSAPKKAASSLALTASMASQKYASLSRKPEEYLYQGMASQGLGTASQRPQRTLPKTRTQVAMDMRAGSSGAQIEGKPLKKKFRARAKWKMHMKIKIIVMMLIGVVFALAFLKKPKSGKWGDFGPRKTMYCGNLPNFIFIAISRLTAYAMYPCFWLLFLTKCHFLRTKMFGTQVSLYVHLEETHHLHVYCGWWVFLMTWLHCVFHVIRWARRGDMHYIYEHQTGITGLIGWICCTLVVLPMGLRKLRIGIKWEIRKHGHTILGTTFLVAVAFHAPDTNVFWLCIPAVIIYGCDWLYIQFFKTFLATSSHFHRLTDGVVMYFDNPKGFVAPQGGYYLNLCVPFISRYQWHALTVYPHPDIPNASCVCIINNGDWSKAIHTDVEWQTKRPVWVQGPFLSPYAAVLNYDNAICVASGSGITAALGALVALREQRRVNLMWICRDASMVEFYLNNITFDEDAFSLIFYTGKRPLACIRDLPDTTLVFEERPDLRSAICMCIHMIESSTFLPEALLEQCDRRMERMKKIAEEILEIDDTLPGHVILDRFICQALQKYRPADILTKLDNHPAGKIDEWKVDNLATLLRDVLQAHFSDEGCFELIDKFPSKAKLREFFEEAMDSFCATKSTHTQSMRPSDLKERFSNKAGSTELNDYLGEMETEVAGKRLNRWSICYCGGSAPVNAALTKVCTDFGIDYNQEGFEW